MRIVADGVCFVGDQLRLLAQMITGANSSTEMRVFQCFMVSASESSEAKQEVRKSKMNFELVDLEGLLAV